MSENPFAKFAPKTQPPQQTEPAEENPFAKFGRKDMQLIGPAPRNEGVPDLLKKPMTEDERNSGFGVVVANNLPAGEEMLVGMGHPEGFAQSVLGLPQKLLQFKMGGGARTFSKEAEYNAELDRARDLEKRYWEENPGAMTYVYGMGPGILAGGAATRTLNPAVAPLQKIMAGGAEGAAAGSIYGYGAGEGDAENRAESGAYGGAAGSLFGLAAPVVGMGAGHAYRRAADALTSNRALRGLGLSRESGALMGESLGADNSLGAQGVANIQRAGSDAMVADAGPNAAGLLDLAIQRGGTGATRAREAINRRAAGANLNLRAAFDQVLGRTRGVEAANTATRQGTAAPRQAAYDAAYAAPIDYASHGGAVMEDLLHRVPQTAIDRANQLMRLEGTRSRQIMARIADDGTVTYETMPDVRQLDYITRALNDVAQSNDGMGAMRGQTAVGRAYQNLSRDIRGNLRAMVPEYGHALDTAADPIREIQARELGAALLSPKTTRDHLATELQGMSQAERRAIGEGVRAHLDEVVANVNRAASDPNLDARQAAAALKAISSDAAREKIGDLLGERAAGRLFQQMDEASSSLELRARVADNSKTFPRMAADRMARELADAGPVGKAMQGEFPGAFKRLVSTVTGRTPRRMLTRENQKFDEVVRALTEHRGPAAATFVRDLERATARQAGNQRTADRVQSGLRRMLTSPAGVAGGYSVRP